MHRCILLSLLVLCSAALVVCGLVVVSIACLCSCVGLCLCGSFAGLLCLYCLFLCVS